MHYHFNFAGKGSKKNSKSSFFAEKYTFLIANGIKNSPFATNYTYFVSILTQ